MLTVDREALGGELTICAKAGERSSMIPILNTTLLATLGESLTIANTDLEITTISRVGYEGSGDLRACVDTERLLRYSQGAVGPTIQIDFDDRAVTLRSGLSSRARISLVGVDGFPATPKPNGGPTYLMPSSDLRALLSRVTYCIARREAKYAVHSCLMERDSTGWIATAIDGYRVATARAGEGGGDAKILFPLRLCIEAQKVFAEEESLTLTVDENYIHIDGSVRTMIARRQTERFPDVGRYTNKKNPETESTCDRLALKRALSVACGFAEKDPNGLIVTLAMEADRVIVSSKAGAYGTPDGEYEEAVAAKHSGPALCMKFTAAALLDALGVMASDEIKILAWGRLDPIHFIPIDSTTALHLVQPRMGGVNDKA